MLQPIREANCFTLKKVVISQEEHQFLGTEVYLRYMVLLATYLVTNILITIEGI